MSKDIPASKQLLPTEFDELRQCEAIIESGLQTFIEVGTALLAIRDGRLYRTTHKTFEDYCRERWNLKQSRAYQLMDAASVVNGLASQTSTIVEVPLPKNEAQARPLAPLNPPQRLEAWSEAVKSAPNGKPTARHVEEAVAKVTGKEAEKRTTPPDQTILFGDKDDADQDDVESEEPDEDDSEDDDSVSDDDPEDDPASFRQAFNASPTAPVTVSIPPPKWDASELERRDLVERCGLSVLANHRTDHRLIEWAKQNGLFVSIDRGSYPLGNPMKLDQDHDRDTVIAWYRDHWLPFHYDQINWAQLEGKVLGCWCYPEPCHGNVIIDQLPSEDASTDGEN